MGTFGSISRAQARMPPLTFFTFFKPMSLMRKRAMSALRTPLRHCTRISSYGLELVQAVLHLIFRDHHRPVDVGDIPLVWLAHIQQQGVGLLQAAVVHALLEFLHRDLWHAGGCVVCLCTARGHAAERIVVDQLRARSGGRRRWGSRDPCAASARGTSCSSAS